MPRENEVVNALDESFNTRLERALAQEATGSLSLENSRSIPRSPVQKEGYLSDDDKFQKLLDKKLVEEQEKLDRVGIPARDGIPLAPIPKSLSSTLNSSRTSASPLTQEFSSSSTSTSFRPNDSEDKENETYGVRRPAAASTSASAPVRPKSSRSRETFVTKEPVTISHHNESEANPNESVVADLPRSKPFPSFDRRTRVLETSAVSAEEESSPSEPSSSTSISGAPALIASAPCKSAPPVPTPCVPEPVASTPDASSSGALASDVDVNDKKLKTPRKAGGKKLAAGTPMVAAKSDAASLLGRLNSAVSGALSNTMDPRQLRDNNRRLAAELNKAKLDMREMHDHHEKERQDLQDEIVRLRQLAGEKDDGVREMLEKRVERALTCHNGALEKVATLLGDDVPTKLHCRISFILEKTETLKEHFDGLVNFLFPGSHPTGKFLETYQLIHTVFENTQEHDEMVRNFIEKLSDAQLNLQLALEDDVDFLSSSAMPTIMNPLNASTMHHDKTRLPQILSDKTEALQRNGSPWGLNEENEFEDGSGTQSQTPHELSNVMEEDESKRASSYLLARKRSSAVTRRTSVAPQRQSAENEEVVRRNRSSRRDSMRLSSGFPQAVCKSPRVSQLQGAIATTPINKSVSNDPDSPASVDGSIDVLDRPVLSPTLSLKDESIAKEAVREDQAVTPIDLSESVHNATSTEMNDMDLTTPDVAPSTAETGTSGSSDPKPVDIDIGCSSFGNESVDSLITPSTRRTSSFVRLYTTPPEDKVETRKSLEERRSLPEPSPLAREENNNPTVESSGCDDGEEEEPSVKKMKTTHSAVTEMLPPPPPPTMAPPPTVLSGCGSRKSKISAALHLKETSFDDSAVFAAPAPPTKAKAAPKKKKEATKKNEKEAEKKSAEDEGKSSSGRPSKGQKIGDVDMDTYKKMVVGQKAKPARSKSRKLSKSEEQEIRAAAEVKAKSKPLEYAAFDASSRFGEGLSFLDETHVPTLTEFKKKQLGKPQAPSEEGVGATSKISESTSTAPPLVAAATAKSAVEALKSNSGRAASVSEDFLTSGSVAPKGKGKGKGGRGGRRSKSFSGNVGATDDDDDDDDFVPKKPRKKAAPKKAAAAKKATKKKEEEIFHSPIADVAEKGKGKRKKSSSQFFSCDDNGSPAGGASAGNAASSDVPKPSETLSPKVADNPTGRRRGRGPPKSYAEPPLGAKMRR